jgi:hypothetical protein
MKDKLIFKTNLQHIFPDLNTIINKMYASRLYYSSRKKALKPLTSDELKKAIKKYPNFKTIDFPCRFVFTFQLDKNRKDLDNLSVASKFILDSAQDCNLITQDSLKVVRELDYRYEQKRDKMEVKLEIFDISHRVEKEVGKATTCQDK